MFIWKEDGDFIRTTAGWWIINRESVKLGESVSKMCKQPSNFNNGEKYERGFERVQYWKRGINLLWRELVGLLMFVVQLQKSFSPSFIVSVLYNLSALPDFKHWMVEKLASLCLEGDIGRGFFLIHCIFFPLFLLSPLEAQQLCLLCSPCSSTIGNAACAQSKPRSVLKLSP